MVIPLPLRIIWKYKTTNDAVFDLYCKFFLAKGNVKLAIRKKGSQRLHVATDIALLNCIMTLEDSFWRDLYSHAKQKTPIPQFTSTLIHQREMIKDYRD